MWRRALTATGGAVLQKQAKRLLSAAPSTTTSVSAAVNSVILRSLKDHYLEISKMTPPPKINPPSPFTVIKGALDSGGPVLKRSYGDEEISISVTRLDTLGTEEDGDDADDINQLFLHVDISKPGQSNALLFLCGLYPDALGIHSVAMRPKTESGYLLSETRYNGPIFEEVGERLRDALHGYIEERGINQSLFPFLQAWLYVKDYRNLMRWYQSVGSFVTEPK